MNKQQIYDTVREHAKQMDKCSENENGTCQYRTEDGGKCFVGVLISDKQYKEEFDGWMPLSGVAKSMPKWFGRNLRLLADLQEVHDKCYSKGAEMRKEFRKGLRAVAKKHGLEPR